MALYALFSIGQLVQSITICGGGIMIYTRIVLACFVVMLPTICRAEPLLRYTFDETSGDALDYGDAPPANAALQGGATRSANTPNGRGYSLDLRDDDATYAHAVASGAEKLDGLSALTLTTWLNLEAYTGGNNRLISKQTASFFGGFSWNMKGTPNTGVVGPDNFR
jgi:hypothetical protein